MVVLISQRKYPLAWFYYKPYIRISFHIHSLYLLEHDVIIDAVMAKDGAMLLLHFHLI